MPDEITNIKTNMARFEEKLDNTIETTKRIESKIDCHIQRDDEQINEVRQAYKDFIKESKETFASKNVEIIVYGMVSLILVAFIGTIINNVLTSRGKISAEEVKHLIEENNNKYFEVAK